MYHSEAYYEATYVKTHLSFIFFNNCVYNIYVH